MALITTANAAKKLGVHQTRIQVLIREGRLPAQMIGGTYVIEESDLALVAERKPGRPKKDTAAEAEPTAQPQSQGTAKPKMTTAQKKAIADEQQRRWRNEKPVKKAKASR